MNEGRFKKGMTPWNKGKYGYIGANKTSFTKENASYYIFKDGFLDGGVIEVELF